MIHLAAEGQGKHEALGGGKEWVIRNFIGGGSEEQTKAVHHVLGSRDFMISFTGPAGAGKTELMMEAVTAIESLSGKRVVVLAPSSPSVEVLRAKASRTLTRFNNSRLTANCMERLRPNLVGGRGWISVGPTDAGVTAIRG